MLARDTKIYLCYFFLKKKFLFLNETIKKINPQYLSLNIIQQKNLLYKYIQFFHLVHLMSTGF